MSMDQSSHWLCLFSFTFIGIVFGFYLIIPWSLKRHQSDKRSRWLRVWAIGWIFLVLAVFSGCLAYGTAWLDWTATLSIFVCSLLWVTAFVLFLNANWVVIPMVLAVPIFWAVSMKVEDDRDTRKRSDEVLLAKFQRHYAVFDQLVQMKKTDKKLISVNSDLTYPANNQVYPSNFLNTNTSQIRIQSYYNLMRQAEISSVVTDNTDKTGIDLYAWGVGNALSSDTDKGYAYLVKPPVQFSNSLDNISVDDNHEIVAYRHIRGNWYLFYKHLPG